MFRLPLSLLGIAVLVSSLLPGKTQAIDLSLIIDSNLSVVNITGNIPFLEIDDPMEPGNTIPLPVDPQVDGIKLGDVTKYTGTMNVTVDNPLAPTTIKFNSSQGSALNSGNWLPSVGGGSTGGPSLGDGNPGVAAPGNYGLYIDIPDLGTLYLAFRDLVLNGTSNSLSVANDMFNANLNIQVSDGSSDVYVSTVLGTDEVATHFDIGNAPYANTPSQMGSYIVNAGIATVTIPVDFTTIVSDPSILGGIDLIELRYLGTIVATAVVAEPSGDFDGDGDVDGSDFLAWQAHFPTASGGLASHGDADGNGTIDATDLAIWQSQYGSGNTGTGSLATNGGIPEPSSIALMACLLIGWFISRWS